MNTKLRELKNVSRVYTSTKLSELKYTCFGRPHYSIELREGVYSIN